MSLSVYQFDSIESYPLLDADTTARGPVRCRVVHEGGGAYLAISYDRVPTDGDMVEIVLLLPPRAVGGEPQKIEIDVLGDGRGCSFFVDAGDARGWGFTYRFAPLQSIGWVRLQADIHRPNEYWGSRASESPCAIVPPVQLCRLGVVLEGLCAGIDVGVRALSMTGDVWLGLSGIA